MLGVEQPAEGSNFSQAYEDYRKASRDKYMQQQAPIQQEVHEQEKEEVINNTETVDEVVNSFQDISLLPEVDTTSNVPAQVSSPSITPTPVENLRKSGSLERRNSLGKVFSAVSNVFTKKPSNSPTIAKKKLTKEEKDKKEQDWRMARLIAELEFSGKSDEEIQMHLFQIRDQSQFQRPRSNSVGEWFKSMHLAFKDEFSVRRQVPGQVSTVNPFYGAPPSGMNDIGFTYEDLVALENVPRGVKSLDHLPVLTYEGQELPSAQTSCAVCMMEFEKSEELRSLHCTHHFHKECIDKWLTVGSTCPVCKSDVESDA